MSRIISRSLPTIAAAALLAACAESPTSASPLASNALTPHLATGFPSGTTLYKFNLLGVPKGKTASMTGDQGKRMFVPLWGNAKIYLQQGPFDIIDANGTDANGATFQLPDPQIDDTEYTWYGVYIRPKGKPGGKATLTSCKIVDSEELCSTESYLLVRGSGKPQIENVSKELLTVCLDLDHIIEQNPCDIREFLFDDALAQYLWNVDNEGLKNAEVRFIEIPQGPFTQPQ
jgi:hypothetical protein